MGKSEATGGGVSFCGMLTILFIGLKLGKVIDWSWWWVVSPMWIPLAIMLSGCVVFLIVFLLIVPLWNWNAERLNKQARNRQAENKKWMH